MVHYPNYQTFEELEDNVYFSPAGYKWLTTEGEYLFFLSPLRTVEYAIVGAYQGKFDYTIQANHTEKPKDTASFKAAFLDDSYEYFGEHMEKFNEHKRLTSPITPIKMITQRREVRSYRRTSLSNKSG